MRCENTLRQDKGVAGLTILLSLVVFLFIIGLLIMIFSLMGGEIKDTSSIVAGASSSAVQEDVFVNDETATALTECAEQTEGALTSVVAINSTLGTPISSANYTISGCSLLYVEDGSALYNNSGWNITYSYTFAGQGYDVINDTVAGIGTAVDWFDIFVVIGAMVVLILLTVIIIISIRGSGLMTGGSTQGNQNLGSA